MSRDPASHREATPSGVRALLDRYGLAPRRADGQNFLVDPNTVDMIVAGADLSPHDHVVEVGPGLGAITGPVADRVAHLTAIEVDAGLVGVLGEVLGDRDDLTILHADALTLDFDDLSGRPDRLVANLPYAIATPLVLHAFAGEVITDAWLMVQREVGERWAATVGDAAHGAVSVKLALVAEVGLGMAISRNAFHPVPRVDSVMVRVRRRPDALAPADRRAVSAVVDVAFAQRRKTLRNNLRRAFDDAEDALARAGIDPARRAETLTPDEFVGLATALGVLASSSEVDP